MLDANITPELKYEGQLRDLTRGIQELRKKANLTPGDDITLTLVARDEAGKALLSVLPNTWKKSVNASVVHIAKEGGKEDVHVDSFTLGVILDH
jgi:hypothetical protein